MILLDTDHITVMKYQDTERYRRLVARLATVSGEQVGATVVTIEEQMRGWLASIAKERQVHRQVGPYQRLTELFDFFTAFEIAPFSEGAADLFVQYNRIRIGSMDKKIAAIAVANNALLLTAETLNRSRTFGSRTGWTRPVPEARRTAPTNGSR